MAEFSETSFKWLWTIVVLPATWLVKLIWSNNKSIQEIRLELAKSPSSRDIEKTKDETIDYIDTVISPIKEGHTRIESKLDKLIDRELNRK